MIKKPTIVVVDYGVGNLYSVIKSLVHLGVKPIITEDAQDLERAAGVILPGVGAFAAGMNGIKIRGLVDSIKEYALSGKPILGICLGAQLMLNIGYEFGEHIGLGLISGKVVHFSKLQNDEKIPHVGWNKIYPPGDLNWQGTILENISAQSDFYFVHSYILQPSHKDDILALTDYGSFEFCSIIKKGNIIGCQFHPEKSGPIGLSLIKEFVNLCQT